MGETHACFENRNMDFISLTSIIENAEASSLDDIESLSNAYDSLLLEFPLCYSYWERYAHHMSRLLDNGKALAVFERAVKVATYSVDLWASYCCFAVNFFDDIDDIRRLYERALSFVSKDYLCSRIWDKYIEFELANKDLVKLSHIYLRALMFPSKNLHQYYDRFINLVHILEKEINIQNPRSLLTGDGFVEILKINDKSEPKLPEMTHILNQLNLLEPSVYRKYYLAGGYFYSKSCSLNEKIFCFETSIGRSYFHVQPLDDQKLENWHQYLDFVEKHGDLDWIVKLYEKCLIPCANYQEYWIRYAEYMEANGGREIAKNAIERALKIFLKGNAAFNLYSIRFKERIGDVDDARASLSLCFATSTKDFISRTIKCANMEKRLGNVEEACQLYENAILIAEEKHDIHSLSILYAHFARFKFVVTGKTDAAKEIFSKALMKMPYNKYLLEALLQFFLLHGGFREINDIDSMIERVLYTDADASCTLSIDDRMDISCLFIEFLDLYGTTLDIEKAWCRHRKLFLHLIRPASLNYDSIKEKHLSQINKEVGMGRVTSSAPLPLGGLSRLEGISVQFDSKQITQDEKNHCQNTSKEEKILVEDVERPHNAQFNDPKESNGLVVKEEAIHDALASETPTILSHVKHQVSVDVSNNVPSFESAFVDSPANKESSIAISGSECSFDKTSSPEFNQLHGYADLPAQGSSQLENRPVHNSVPLLCVHEQAPEALKMKGTIYSSVNVASESTSICNVNDKESSLGSSMAATRITQSMHLPARQDLDSMQAVEPTQLHQHEQARQSRRHDAAKSPVYQDGCRVCPQNHQTEGCASACSFEHQKTPQTSPTVHMQDSQDVHYHQNQQEVSHQMWHYYQQMYYLQQQQHNLQLQMQYRMNEQPLHSQHGSPYLPLPDGRDHGNQPINQSQTVQWQYLQLPFQQNYLYQQYHQYAGQQQTLNHPPHQHSQPQIPQGHQLPLYWHPHGYQGLHQRPFQPEQQPTTVEQQHNSSILEQMQPDLRIDQQQPKIQLGRSAFHLHQGIHSMVQDCGESGEHAGSSMASRVQNSSEK